MPSNGDLPSSRPSTVPDQACEILAVASSGKIPLSQCCASCIGWRGRPVQTTLKTVPRFQRSTQFSGVYGGVLRVDQASVIGI
jgi:hypothetical protein